MNRRGIWGLPLFLGLFLAAAFSLYPQDSAGPSARELYLRGRDAQTDLDFYRAIELYGEAIEKNPAYIDPIIGLSECYRMLDEYEEALAHITAARKIASARTDLINLEARIRMGMGELAQSTKLFSSVLEKQPYNLDARLGLAELALAEGRMDTAERRYLDILSTAQSDRKTLLSLFLLYDSLGNTVTAERYLDTALRFHPDDPQVHYLAGLFYARRNDLSRAAQQTATALTLNPAYPGAVLLSGKIALGQGNAQEAAALMRSVVQGNAGNPEAWYVLAQALIALADIDAGIQAYERAIRLSPEEELLRLALERTVLSELPLEDRRRTAYGAYHFTRGKALEGRNYFEQAEAEYRRGLMLSPYSDEGRRLFAEILRKNGKPGKYLSELNLIKSLGSSDRSIDESIERAVSLLRDSIPVRWKLDTEKLVRDRYRLAVFFAPDGNRTAWGGADQILASYFTDMLSVHSNLSVLPGYPRSGSYAEAFRTARAAGADYFVLISSMDDDGTDTSLAADLHLARTGTKISSVRKNGTGSGRVYRAVSAAADAVSAILPVRGTLVSRDFERALVDIGTDEGLSSGKKLLVLKKNTLELRADAPGFLYNRDDIIGEIEVTGAGEAVSEGIITRRGFFDLVQPGDTVLYEVEGRDRVQEKTSVSPGLFRRILQVR